MKNICLFMIAFSGVIMLSSSTRSTYPDPETFAKQFVETIRQNNRDVYMKTFAPTIEDLQWIAAIYESDSAISESEKVNFREEFNQPELIRLQIWERMDKGFYSILYWAARDTVDLSKLQYIRSFYELEYNEHKLAPTLEILIYVKYQSRYYAIEVDDAVFLNGHWVYGEIDEIDEVDKNLNHIYNDYYDGYEAAVADTAAAAAYDDYYADDVVADSTAMSVNPKQEKIYKKINKLQNKIDQLYSEIY